MQWAASYGDGPLELVDYSAPGVFANPNTGGYFSVNNGVTNLANFAAAPRDTADWASSTGDNFGYQTAPDSRNDLTPVDQEILGTLGFNENPSAPSKFDVFNITTNVASHQDGINVTSHQSDTFIHTGSGMDGINVSQANGNNILDGSTGSNFLTGGTGDDTFYMDDRDPALPVFSTIVNFHAGDNATVWGVNPTDFTRLTLDNQGASGFLGLDVLFTAPGHVNTSFVLAGYTSPDLTNGRLAFNFGTTQDLPGLPGSQYLTVHGN